MNASLIDRDLAARLGRHLPDVADDGFTSSVMAALPTRAPAAPARQRTFVLLPNLLLAGAGLLACVLMVVLGGGEMASAAPLAERALPAMQGFELARLSVLLDAHLYTILAAALCAATMLVPQVLED